MTKYSLPSDDTNIIKTGSNSLTESASDDDCCEASDGVHADLLQACDSKTTEENEVLSWIDGVCMR